MEEYVRPQKRLRFHEPDFSKNEIVNLQEQQMKIKRKRTYVEDSLTHITYSFKKIRVNTEEKPRKQNIRKTAPERAEGNSLPKRQCSNSLIDEISIKISEISLTNPKTSSKYITTNTIIQSPNTHVEISNSKILTKEISAIILIQKIIRGWIYRNKFRFVKFGFYI